MTQIATVTEVLDNGRALLAVRREGACGHKCASCSVDCGAVGGVISVEAKNTVNARKGERVVVYSSTKKLLGAALLVYLVPVVLFIAAAALCTGYGLSAGVSSLISVAAFLLGVIIAVIYGKRERNSRKITYEIIEILD
ncbi:MAG: SoxR reducing system RseC family protein [Oscillospiraceae bacterium]|jgi:sigma-E factor negative regulatory protein RseC